MGDRHIELQWRCSSCQATNLGRHMACQGCGNPKDDSEEYEMPADTSQAASVTDERLLEMARAGENWRCGYCGSAARDLDGGCKQCGAGRREGANARSVQNPPEQRNEPRRRRPRAQLVGIGAIAIAAVLVVVGIVRGARQRSNTRPSGPAAVVTAPPVRTDFQGEVIAASWSRTIAIQRWQLVAHEAFTSELPHDAIHVIAAGQRVHHHEDVFDHDETVYDDVIVPDGYRTESYTERVKCGEDCTTSPRRCRQVCKTTPKTCREVCTNKKNGFASCRDVCTGGDQSCRDDCTGGDRSCTARYCSESKTRQVAKTRIEKRPRVVKKYRSEPRYAAWSTYETWEWVENRRVEESGTDVAPRWPDSGLASTVVDAPASTRADGGAPKPGAEREIRAEHFTVQIRTDDGRTHAYAPSSEEELARLAPGARDLRVRVDPQTGTVTLL